MDIAMSIELTAPPGGANDIVIGGMFRLHGSITAWGILGVGCEATLTLRYIVNDGLLKAKGRVVGWVQVLAWQKEWIVEAEDEFVLDENPPNQAPRRLARAAAGPGVDPGSFGDVYSSPQWAKYCGAFA
jgi:hypothetical protein